MRSIDRRAFLKKGACGVGSGILFLQSGPLATSVRPGANDRIGIGLIGCGGMGRANLKNCAKHPAAVITAVCDVWGSRRERTAAHYKKTAKPYRDYRRLLEDKNVHGVIIATPPHWHTLQAIAACEAKKDIYLQKPMTLYLAESIALCNAVEKYDRVSQIGTQIHAGSNFRRVVEKIRAGYIGPVTVIRTFNVMNQGRKGVGHAPPTAPPADLDWDFWLGPGPKRPFNPILARDSYHHCSWWDYSGGWTCGMAPHILDLPVWACKLGLPKRVASSGGRYLIDDDGDAPDVQEILWQYDNLTVTWQMSLVNSYGFDLHGKPVPRRRLGIYFHGLDATLYADYQTHHVVPEGDRLKDRSVPKQSIPPSPGHEFEWINCMKTREEPSCSVFYHHRVNVPIVLGNLALRVGRTIHFDPRTQKIKGDPEAARLAQPAYRDPWTFPTEYMPA